MREAREYRGVLVVLYSISQPNGWGWAYQWGGKQGYGAHGELSPTAEDAADAAFRAATMMIDVVIDKA